MQAAGNQFVERHAVVVGDLVEADVDFPFFVFGAEIEGRPPAGNEPSQSLPATWATSFIISRILLPAPPSPENSPT